MILASCHNTMRHAVPVYDPESPDERLRRKLAERREADRKRRLWIEAIDRAKADRSSSRAGLIEAKIANQFSAMPPWAREIVRSIAQKHGVDLGEMFFSRKRGPARTARNEICYVLRGTLSPVSGEAPSLPVIGRWIGKEHTSVLHAIANHQHENGLPALTTRSAEKKRQASREWHERRRRSEAR